jgi:hypothetical protein
MSPKSELAVQRPLPLASSLITSLHRNPTTTASTELASAEPDPSLPAGPAAQLTALFARLSEASSRATIDAVAVDFAFLNSKAARRRLVKVRRRT